MNHARYIKQILTIGMLYLVTTLYLGNKVAKAQSRLRHTRKNFGYVTYQAKNCFNAERGTFEIRFKPGYDPEEKLEIVYYVPMAYMFVLDKRRHLLCLTTINKWWKARSTFSSSLYVSGAFVKPYGVKSDQSKLGWEKNKWTNLALTWKYDDGNFYYQLYANGELIVSDTREGEWPEVDEDAILQIGRLGSYATIDYIHLSSVVRTPEEIAEAIKYGVKADNYTLLLDEFDNVNGELTLPAQGPQGTIRGYFLLLNNTIQLFRDESETDES